MFLLLILTVTSLLAEAINLPGIVGAFLAGLAVNAAVRNRPAAGKLESISNAMIGRRPIMAAGNSAGDRRMLEYTKAGDGARLSMLVLHDDAKREYAYGPAQGLPDTKVGNFPQALYDQAQKQGWIVISMKNDSKKIFAFEP